MRIRPFSLVLLAVPLLLLAVRMVIWASDAETARTGADPGKASAFLQNYSPQPVIRAFALGSASSWASEGRTSTGGAQSVRNDRQLRAGFAACAGRSLALTAALDEDLLAQLRFNKAAILFRTGSPQTGIHMVYRMDRTLGVVRLQPVGLDRTMHRASPLPGLLQDMRADLTLSETWYRSDQAADQAFRESYRF